MRAPSRQPIADASPEVRSMLIERYRGMAPEERLERMRELTIAVNQLALAGLRARHPLDDEAALRRRLARIRLGATIADAVYGSELADGTT